uniref:Aminoacyl-transfer RNA synthetases class-II family profile domain-containing protein n=1 Tax=Fagus sylvatica TaxID=28930 RepID=A0A2N9IL61_FAGSY
MAMNELTRKWRNSRDDKFSLPTLDDSRPIDTQEQEEMIRSFEKTHAQQSRLWRYFNCTLSSSRLHLHGNWYGNRLDCQFGDVLNPYILRLLGFGELFKDTGILRYHAYFMEEVDSWMIISADWIAVLACSFTIIGLLHNSKNHRQWMWYSCFAGIILAVFWLYYMIRLPKFRWDVIWLPFAPLGGAGICLYVDHLILDSSEEIRKLRAYSMVSSTPFERISYTEAVELLEEAVKSGRKFENQVEWGIDLASEHERYLTEVKFKKPVIVYNYPKDIKAFYMKVNDDCKTVAAMDVLVPKVGELIGGSQREERYEVIQLRIQEMGLPLEPYEWYLDLRRYGTVKHSGFGLGFERMLLFATGIENIRDVIPFPRYSGRADL